MRSILLPILLCFMWAGAAAQGRQRATTDTVLTPKPKPEEDDEMNASLADQAEDTHVLQPGDVQLEGAFLLNHFDTGKNALIGRALLRVGVLKWLELRAIGEDGRNRDQYLEETTQSVVPLGAGLRAEVAKQKGLLPDIGITAYLKLPFTSRTAEQLPYWSPAVVLAAGYKLGDKWDFIVNGGFRQEPFSRDKAWMGNAEIEYKLGEKTELFAEYAGQYQRTGHPQHNADAGVVYALTDNVQAWAAGGGTLNSKAPNAFGMVGIALRRKR